ncbi:MAG: MucB/RseB C-terminal domain-containing protein [Woeseiaceae bacterium]
MILRSRKRPAALSIALCAVVFAVLVANAQDDPHDWLERMSGALRSTTYEGTVIRVKGGSAEALKVVRTISDGVIRERVVAQDGNGLEIIRNGNEVHCILPDTQSVLVEKWNDQSTLFTKLPSRDLLSGNEYDVVIENDDRIAGRKTLVLAIRPHDEYRYSHKIWLDTETGFPLQTKMSNGDDDALELVKFADVRINHEIQASALQPSYSTENFRWFSQPAKTVKAIVESDWSSDDLPLGFRVVETHSEASPGSDELMTHILYTDGVANVSVFITPLTGKPTSEASSVGASNSYSTIVAAFRVTAVGEVPAVTVRQIATSMRLR